MTEVSNALDPSISAVMSPGVVAFLAALGERLFLRQRQSAGSRRDRDQRLQELLCCEERWLTK